MSQTNNAGGSGLARAGTARTLVSEARRIERAARTHLKNPPEAETDVLTVLRVVSAFDELAERGADVADLARLIAHWTDSAAAVSGRGDQLLAHCDRHGKQVASGEPRVGASREVRFGDAVIARVSIERAAPGRALDELVLTRGAHAAQLIVARGTQAADPAPSVPQLVELLIDADVTAIRRSQVCRQLGLEPNQSIRVAVVQAHGGLDDELQRVSALVRPSRGGPPRIALHGEEAILVLRGTLDPDCLAASETGSRWGIGPARPASEAPHSYRRAQEALRFAQGPGAPRVSDFDRLGSVIALAGLAGTDLMDVSDWAALTHLSQTETGLTAILTAEVLMHTGSQRDAATRMNLHHSTVAHRVSHVEHALGYSLGEHANWFRAQLAIHLWRLASSEPATTTPSAGWRTDSAKVPVTAG